MKKNSDIKRYFMVVEIAVSQVLLSIAVFVFLVTVLSPIVKYISDDNKYESRLHSFFSYKGFEVVATKLEADDGDRCSYTDVYMESCTSLDSLEVYFNDYYSSRDGLEPYRLISYLDGYTLSSITLSFNDGSIEYRFYEYFDSYGDRFVFQDTGCEINSKNSSSFCTNEELEATKIMIEYKNDIFSDIRSSEKGLVSYFWWLMWSIREVG